MEMISCGDEQRRQTTEQQGYIYLSKGPARNIGSGPTPASAATTMQLLSQSNSSFPKAPPPVTEKPVDMNCRAVSKRK